MAISQALRPDRAAPADGASGATALRSSMSGLMSGATAKMLCLDCDLLDV